MKPWGLYRISHCCLLVAVAAGMATAGWAAQTNDDLSSGPSGGVNTQSGELLGQAGAILELGSTGSAVKDVQAMLTLMGYYSDAVDGAYEQTTVEAVRQFQVDVGLPADGVVGPLTWSRLLPTPATLANPPQPPSDEPSPQPDGSNSPSEAVLGNDGAVETAGEWPVLKLDDVSTDVSRLQLRLAERNLYTGPIDGGFGIQTEQAVREFQRQAGLEVDGIAGPATWRALSQ